MRRKTIPVMMAVALALSPLAIPPEARAQGGVKVGVLSCEVASGWGFIFGSTRALKCSFTPTPDVSEHYFGKISKFGVDIGYLRSAVIVWAVFGPGANVTPGALAGTYVGATGGASVGVGAGAKVLVGGSRKAFTLQPISIEGNTGLNVAGGIASTTLDYRKK